MKLTSKVSSLLGMKQRSDDATFGESLNLEQIALGYETSQTDVPLENFEPETIVENNTKMDDNQSDSTKLAEKKRRPSVLDLDFMRSPLDEIGLEHESENNLREEKVTLDPPTSLQEPAIEVIGDQNELLETLVTGSSLTVATLPTPKPTAFDPSIHTTNLEPQNSLPPTDEQAPSAPTSSSALSDGETALVLSLRGDEETGYMVCNSQGQILEISEKFQQILSLTSDVATSMQSYTDALNYLGKYIELGDKDVEAEKQKEATRMRSQIEKGAAKSYTMIATTRTGATLKFTNKYTANHHLVTLVSDVSDEIEKQRIFRANLKELLSVKEQSKNKSSFLARMSHEIRTPLNAIVGMTEALRDEVDNDEARETASFIADAADNLNSILSQTLEHERLSTSEILLEEDSVDITDIIKSSAAMWKKQCKNKGLKFNARISPDMPNSIKLDSSRFRQCLTNLLSNAIKFTESGSITLVAAPVNLDGNKPKLLVAVRDTGIGMSPKAAQNVFKPFHQGDVTIQRRFGGSGLGMSITKRIVEAMDGHIKIKSKEGEGSTFAITLPLRSDSSIHSAKPLIEDPIAQTQQQVISPAPNTAEKPQQQQPSISLPVETFHRDNKAPEAPIAKLAETTGTLKSVRKKVPIVPSDYSGFRVLVVEDNPINQAVVRKLLENHIASMDFAFHGDEALEVLETQTFDVILMDIHMPVKDGIETTLEIRNSGKAWADTVIVALTADPDYQQKRVCRNIGMNDALAKPVKRQELLDVMQRVLNERKNREQDTGIAISA